MGIPKLTTIIEKHFTGWQRKELKGNLVVDGNCVRNHCNTCDWSHGGQFPEYKENVLRFYGGLQESGIVPIVVLDGIDHAGVKWPTTIKRSKERIGTIHKELFRGKKCAAANAKSIFPSLGNEVYLQALALLGIEYVVVDGEADNALVQIANHYNCPVLSSDSDFYMYNIDGGFVDLSKINIKKKPITAKVYYYKVFCEQFHFEDETVRLIIPALLGNDLWCRINIGISGAPNKGDHGSLIYVHFASLFDSLESFVNEIPELPNISGEWKHKLTEHCHRSVELYNCSSVLQIKDMLEVTDLHTFKGDSIPLWVLKSFRKGHLSKLLFSMLVTRRYPFNIFIDDTTRESCVVTSRPIRKHMYRIIGCDSVTEHFRVQQQFSSEEIHASESVDGHPLPSLQDMPGLSVPEQEGLLYLILGYDEHLFRSLDEHWKLPIAATAFWQRVAQPTPHLVKSLLLCFLTCSGHLVPQFAATPASRKGPEWILNLHLFAQWQSCYDDAISLDKVLMLPLPVTCPSKLYDGRPAMNFSMLRNIDDTIRNLHADLRQLFNRLLKVILPAQEVA